MRTTLDEPYVRGVVRRLWRDPIPELVTLASVALATVALFVASVANRPRPRAHDVSDALIVEADLISLGRRHSAPECETSGLDDDACWGQVLLRTLACMACHSEGPEVERFAPSLSMPWGFERPLEGGSTVLVDESYVRESIVHSQARIAAGYPSPRMPDGNYSEAQVRAIVAYLRVIRQLPTPDAGLRDGVSERGRRHGGRR